MAFSGGFCLQLPSFLFFRLQMFVFPILWIYTRKTTVFSPFVFLLPSRPTAPEPEQHKGLIKTGKGTCMDQLLCLLIYMITALSGLQARLPGPFRGSFERWEKGKKIKLLLAGYNGARNTGSDVRVAEIAAQALDVFGRDNLEITVMTLDVPSMKGYFGPDTALLPFSSLFPLDLWRACASHRGHPVRRLHPEKHLCRRPDPVPVRSSRHHGGLYPLSLHGLSELFLQ